MAKETYKFITETGEKIFQLKLNSQHIGELSFDSKFSVNKKRKEITSSLFNKMFQVKDSTQALAWSNYQCNICSKMESFLVSNGKVFCNSCFNTFVKKEEENPIASILSTVVPAVSVSTEKHFEQSPKLSEKSFNRKRDTSRSSQQIDLLISETEQNSTKTHLSKFAKKLKKSKDIQKAQLAPKKKDSHLSFIEEKLSSFSEKLNVLGKSVNSDDILYAYHMEKILKDSLVGKTSFRVKSIKQKNNSDRYDLLFYLLKQKTNGIQNSHVFYEFSKLFVSLFVSKFTQFTDEQKQYLLFMNQDTCFISGEYLNETNTSYVYLNPFDKTPFNMIKVSRDSADKYSFNGNILEGFIHNVLSNKDVILPSILEAYLLVEYNRLSASLTKLQTITPFHQLSRDFTSFYNVYIKGMLYQVFQNQVDACFEKGIDVFNIPHIKNVLNEIQTKTAV